MKPSSGASSGSSLVLGGLIALRVSISRRLLGLIMAFGVGVLISAVAYELVDEAFTTSAGVHASITLKDRLRLRRDVRRSRRQREVRAQDDRRRGVQGP